LAKWISDDILASGRTPDNYCFLAKQKVQDYEGTLAPELSQHNIALRNDARMFGKIPLQDLLKNDVTRLVLGVLRLVLSPTGFGSTWLDIIDLLKRIEGADSTEDVRRLGDRVGLYVNRIRTQLQGVGAAGIDGDALVALGTAVTSEGLLNSYVRSAHRGEDLDIVLESMGERFEYVKSSCETLIEVIEAFIASDAAVLMTVHRSKGMEYHTVVFLGLDDDQWWAHDSDREESISIFFVGLSRAAQRVIFTTTRPEARGGRIRDLYGALAEGGVPWTTWS